MKQFNLSSDSIKYLYGRYLFPSICSTMITSAYVIADTIMIGHGIGADALVALNLLLPIFSLQFGIGNMLGIGGGVLASVAMGSGNKKRATEVFSTAIVAATIISVIMSLCMTIMLEPICYMLGASSNTIDYAMKYAIILFACSPAMVFSSCIQGFVRNDKDPIRAMAAVLAGAGLNIILDYIFIYNLDMKMRGAILATIIGNIINIFIACTHFMKKENNLRFSILSIRVSAFFDICKSGITSFLVEMSSGITTFVFNRQILKYIGDNGVIVYSVLTNSAIVCMSLFNGTAQAVQPIVAHNFGAGLKNRVRQVKRLGFIVILGIGMALSVYVNIFPDTLIDAFVKANEAIYHMGRKAIHIYFLCLIPTAVNIYFSNYFQAVMKSKQAFAITFLRGIVFNVIFVLFLPIVFGNEVIWYVVPVTELVTMIITLTLAKSNDTIIKQ